MPPVRDQALLQQLNGGVQTRAPDRKLPYQVEQERYQAQAAPYAVPKAQADAAIAQANAGVAPQVADAEADKAVADARTAQINYQTKQMEAAERNSPEARRNAIQQARQQAETALEAIDQIRTSIGRPGATGPIGQIASFIHGTPAANLEASLESLGGIIGLDKLMEMKKASAVGASGLGALSEKELRILTSQLGSLAKSQEPAQLLRNLGNVEKHFKRALLAINGVHPDEFDKHGFDPFEKLEPTDVNNRAQQMLRQGAGEDKISLYLDAHGMDYDPAAVKANVGRSDAQVITGGNVVPNSFQKGAEHVGARVADAAEWAPNTFLGTNFDLGGDWRNSTEQRFAGQRIDPIAEMAGRATAALPAAFLTRNPFLGGAVENTLVNDSRDATGLAQDALVGGGLGVAGDRVIRGVAGALSPQVADPARRLNDLGIRMTPGQIMGGNANRAEGLRTSLPFAGQRIQGKLDQSYDDVQHGMADEILRPGGGQANRAIEPGGATVADVQRQGSQMYDDALAGTQISANPRLGASILGSLGKHRLRPDVAAELASDLKINLGGMFDGSRAPIPGKSWKEIDSSLGDLAEHYRKQGAPYRGASKAIRDIRGDLFRDLNRQNPGSKARDVRKADQVHRGVRILNNAAARDGANNVPSPGQIMAAIKAEAPMGRSAFARGEAPLQQFASDVQNTMPTYANSRSADRGIAALPTTREGMMAHAQGALLSPLYSEPAQRAFQGFMMRDNYTAPGVANALRNPGLAGVRGAIGSSQGRDLLGMDPAELQMMLEEDARLRRRAPLPR